MLATMTSPRRNTWNPKPTSDPTRLRSGRLKTQKTIDYLNSLIKLHDELSHDEIEQIRQNEFWLPSRPAIVAMLKGNTRQVDRVALVIIDYMLLHGANAPSLRDIADALNITRTRVNEYITELVKAGRAVRSERQFWLTDTDLNHPLRKLLSEP